MPHPENSFSLDSLQAAMNNTWGTTGNLSQYNTKPKAKAKGDRPPCGYMEHAELYVQMNNAHAFCTGCKRMMIRHAPDFKVFATPPIFQTADAPPEEGADLLLDLEEEAYDEIEEDYDDE